MEGVAIGGLVVAAISLLLTIYTLAFKLGALNTKVELLWKIDVEDSLRREREGGAVTMSSAWRITDEHWETQGPTIDPGVMRILEKIASCNPPKSDSDLAALMIKKLGIEKLRERADLRGRSLQEQLALMIVFVRSHARIQKTAR